MKRYQITVNGVAYDVTVEELAGAPAASVSPTPVAPVATLAPAAVAPAPAPAGGTPVNSPMPGTILRVNVKVGDTVKNGDVLMVLEAMKMENDICAPCDGTVAAVAVAQGAAVTTDALLLTLA